MTVGISLTNGLEAIVVTDSRVSGFGRQSDSVNKLRTFESDNYQGVIFAAGPGNVVEMILNNLDSFSANDFNDFYKFIHYKLIGLYKEEKEQSISEGKRNIKIASEVIDDENKRKKFIDAEIAGLLGMYNKSIKNQMSAFFNIVVYDRINKKIRQILIDNDHYAEFYEAHHQIGSGSDGAHMYFTNKLQGVDCSKLKPEELAFFAVNAYSSSLVNFGVGGTPKIAYLNKDGVKAFDSEDTNRIKALANISGAYLSEFNPELDDKKAIEFMKKVMFHKKPPYTKIAKELGLNRETLTTMAIPYGTWQERANSKKFNRK